MFSAFTGIGTENLLYAGCGAFMGVLGAKVVQEIDISFFRNNLFQKATDVKIGNDGNITVITEEREIEVIPGRVNHMRLDHLKYKTPSVNIITTDGNYRFKFEDHIKAYKLLNTVAKEKRGALCLIDYDFQCIG